MERGESVTFKDQPFIIERQGHPEEAFFILACSPVGPDVGDYRRIPTGRGTVTASHEISTDL
jgi:hypothetical protein